MAIPNSEEGDFVEGIYNWCDRWCERCPMTTRCRQYAMECTRDAFNADGSSEGDTIEFFESLMGVSDEEDDEEDFISFLNEPEAYRSESENEEAEDFFSQEDEDFDMDAYMEERERIKTATESTECVKLADSYSKRAEHWFEEWEILLDRINCEEVDEAVDVVRWYMLQIPIKLRRAINGKIENVDYVWEDVYGTAKLALVTTESSLKSWKVIREALDPNYRDSIDHVVGLLKQLIGEIETEVPEARAFKRPGFDE